MRGRDDSVMDRTYPAVSYPGNRVSYPALGNLLKGSCTGIVPSALGSRRHQPGAISPALRRTPGAPPTRATLSANDTSLGFLLSALGQRSHPPYYSDEYPAPAGWLPPPHIPAAWSRCVSPQRGPWWQPHPPSPRSPFTRAGTATALDTLSTNALAAMRTYTVGRCRASFPAVTMTQPPGPMGT